MEEAYRLLHHTIARSGPHELDPKSAMFLIRREVWMDILKHLDMMMGRMPSPYAPRELFGVPVRITVFDPPDTPMVQLVMEPTACEPRIAKAPLS